MTTELESFFNLYQFTTGRRLFTLRQMHAAATERGLTPVARFLAGAIREEVRTVSLEAEWKRRGARLDQPGEAARLDWQIDRILNAVDTVADSHMRAAEPGDPLVAQLERFRADLYPTGVPGVTALPYIEEIPEFERVHGLLKGPYASLVKELGLKRQVARLPKLIAAFKTQVEAKPKKGAVTFDVVRAARLDGQHRLLQAMAMILGTYYKNTAEHVEIRRALLGPVVEQDAQIGQFMKSRRTAPDVDPDTGKTTDEVEPPAPAPEPKPAEPVPVA
jgi:hypothetical protein